MAIKRTFLSGMDKHMLNGEISTLNTATQFTFSELNITFLRVHGLDRKGSAQHRSRED